MENIVYSSLIVSTRTKDGDLIDRSHRKELHIGNENLADFNDRMKTRTVLEYDNDNRSFKVNSSSNEARIRYLSNEFVIDLNRYLTLNSSPDFDEIFIKNQYVNSVRQDVKKLQQEIRRTHHLKKEGLSKQEKEEYLQLIEELITLRKDSYPIGILTDTHRIEECKEEVKELCDDLSKELVRKIK